VDKPNADVAPEFTRGLEEGQDPRRAGRPRERPADWQTEIERLRGPGRARPRGGVRTKDVGGAGRRREGARATRPAAGYDGGAARFLFAAAAGLATGVRAPTRWRTRAGSLPDGDVQGSIDRARRRTVGSRPHGRSTDLANTRSQRPSFRGRSMRGLCPSSSVRAHAGPAECWRKL